MSSTLIKNALIINEGKSFKGSLLIKEGLIAGIFPEGEVLPKADVLVDAEGKWLLPGAIDDQVHFREPGLTHKADIASESAAAVAGGITSFMEMPNTHPQTTTLEALEAKYGLGAEKSLANYSFYMGATNDNLQEVLKVNPEEVCGIKVFMGSSTGNMLVDNKETLKLLFSEIPMLIATHCEDEATIRHNTALFREKYGEQMPFRYHPDIRSTEACYRSSSVAVDLATRYNSRLHILHLSTEKELSLLSNRLPLAEKRITGEVCVHHLWFSRADYDRLGARIKWNPAVKEESDREALREGLKNNLLDVVATDHAPHTLEEKKQAYFAAPSGGPLVEHALLAMLTLVEQGVFTLETVVEKMCHAPATLFRIEKRGYLRTGYHADLVLVDPKAAQTISDAGVHYKCKWSPFSGQSFAHSVESTWVNGQRVFHKGCIDASVRGQRLRFVK